MDGAKEISAVQDPLAGVRWMLMSCLMFSIMSLLIKMATAYCSVAEVLFYRNFPTVLILGVFFSCKGYNLKTPFPYGQWQRATIGNLSAAMQFFALSTVLPLAMVTTLAYTYPLFLALIAIFWSKEKLSRSLLACIFAGFIGVILILRPQGSVDHSLLGSISGLGAGLFAALAYMNIQALSKKGEPEWRTVFYFSAFGSLYSLITIFVFTKGFHAQTLPHLGVLLGIGLSGLMGQLSITRAFSRGQANVTSIFSYTALILSSVWGWLLFHDRVDNLSILGGCIIAISGILVTQLKRPTAAASAQTIDPAIAIEGVELAS
jgi:drug/metabolite transporter (DMT)-like permease